MAPDRGGLMPRRHPFRAERKSSAEKAKESHEKPTKANIDRAPPWLSLASRNPTTSTLCAGARGGNPRIAK
jgi:hypothetical protein